MSRRRQPPRLVVVIPLEGEVRIYVDAQTLADELRLRAWLRRSGRLDDLRTVLERLLDDLDQLDEEAV